MKRPNRRQDRLVKTRRDLRLEPLEDRQLLTTFMVSSNASTGLGTLAAAILLSNADVAQTNTIDFAIPGTGTHTIALTTPLPTITQAVNIDATTQTGYVANSATTGDNEVPAIILDGTNAGLGLPGVDFLGTATGSSLQGLQIQGFTGDAVDVGANNVTVSADLIGVGPSGSDSIGLGNGGIGVSVQNSTGVTISGVEVGSSSGYGIFLSSSPTASLTGVTVTGTLASGATPGDGIRIDASDHVSLSRVTVSGNAGIGINDSGSSKLSLVFSKIQSNQGGGLAFVNSDEQGSSDIEFNTIGGTVAGLGNGVVGVLTSNANEISLVEDLIAGNAGPGVLANAGSAASDGAPIITSNTISGNAGDGVDVNASINLNLDFSLVVGNKGVGVSLTNQSTGASFNTSTIGGTAAGQANGGIGLLVVGSDNLHTLDSVILDAAGFGVELMRSDFATLTGITVAGSTKLGDDLGDGVLSVLSRSLVVSGGLITGNAGIGINLNQSASASIQGATVASNKGGGFDLHASGLATVSGTTVGGTVTGTTPGNTVVGILVNGSTNASLTGDLIAGNQGNGVTIGDGSTSTLISGGTVSGNVGDGIAVLTSLATITGTRISGSTGDGIDAPRDADGLIVGGSTTASGDQILGNNSFGIELVDAANATITNDTLNSNTSRGIDAAGDAELTLNNDTVTGSGSDGIYLYQNKTTGGGSLKGAVTGLNCSSNGAGGNGGNGFVDLGVPGLQLLNGTFGSNKGPGAVVGVPDAYVVGNSSFDNNFATGLSIEGGPGGVIGGAAGPVEILNTQTYQNDPGFTSKGLDLSGASNFSISNLTITGTQGPAISGFGLSGGTISATTIGGATASLGNSGGGIVVFDSNGVTLGAAGAPVVIENNTGGGILLTNVSSADTSSNFTLDNLTIEANSGIGIDLEKTTGTTLANSTIEFQGGVGLTVNLSDNTTLNGNTISGNTGQNIVVTNSKNFVNND